MGALKFFIFLAIFLFCEARVNAGVVLTCRSIRDRRPLNKACSVSCEVGPKNVRIEVACTGTELCNHTSDIKINPGGSSAPDLGALPIDLLFLDAKFPDNFSLANFTRSLGLDKIDAVNIVGLLQRSFTASKNFLLDSGLRSLEINRLDIRRIPENFLEGASSLVHLKIAYTKLEKLGAQDFTSARELRSLDLSFNEIKEIEAGAFDSLVNLHKLVLSYNKLETLPERVFKNLSDLIDVHLDSNNLRELPADLFRIDPSRKRPEELPLKWLEADGTKNDSDDDTTDGDQLPVSLPVPKTRSKRESSQTTTPSSGVTQNEDEETMAEIHDWKYNPKSNRVRQIYLCNNNLSSLPAGLFGNCNKLKLLDLSYNMLAALPAGLFRDTKTLNELVLKHNKLASLNPEVLEGLSHLKTLDLSVNRLKSIDYDFCNYLPNVRMLTLTKNLLKNLESSRAPGTSIFSECRQILNLTLDYNQLTMVYSDWISSDELRNLSIANNRIKKTKIDSCTVNVDMNLRNNRMSSIDLNLNDFFRDPKSCDLYESDPGQEIDLRGNKWNCSCENFDLLRYVHLSVHSARRLSFVLVTTNETCASPPSLAGTPLTQIDPQTLNCN